MEEVSGVVVLATIAEMMGLKKAPPVQIHINAKNTQPNELKLLIMINPVRYIVKERISILLYPILSASAPVNKGKK